MSEFMKAIGGCVRKMVTIRERERSTWLQKSADIERSLTSSEIAILEIVYRLERSGDDSGTPYSRIVNEMDEDRSTNIQVTKSAVTQAISKLEIDGYITKDKGNPRRPTVKLTDKGRHVGYGLDNIDRFLILKLFSSEGVFTRKKQEAIKAFFLQADKLLSDYDAEKPVAEVFANADAARLYDYLIGGQFYLPIEEQCVDQLRKVVPHIGDAAKANRAFMRRAVNYLAEKGIRQYIDIGCGLLSYGNVHEIVSEHFDDYRVLYVDSDPYVGNIAKYMVPDEGNFGFLQAELEKTDDILDEAKRFGIDSSQPVAIIAVATLHFIKDYSIIEESLKKLCQAISSGSYLVISHVCVEEHSSEKGVQEEPAREGDKLLHLYGRLVSPVFKRSKNDVRNLFDRSELELVSAEENQGRGELAFAPQWRPDIRDKYLLGQKSPLQDHPERSLLLVGVGRKG